MLTGMLLGIGWFGVFALAHVALFHFRDVERRFLAIARIFGLAVLGVVASAWLIRGYGVGVVTVLVGSLVMGSLFVLYMPFYYTLSASLSVRTLLALKGAPDGRAPLAQLVERFSSVEVVRGRLETMAANGYLRREGEAYRLTPKGLWVATVFRAIKKIWRLGPGG